MIGKLKIQLVVATTILVFVWFGGTVFAAENQALPLSLQRVLYQAQTLIAKNDLKNARLKLESYRLKEQHSHYLIEFTLGDILMLKSAHVQAAEAYRKALDLNPDFAPAWMNLGKALYEEGDYSDAADCFHRAYQTNAEAPPNRLYYSATAYLMAERPQQGLEVFQRLLTKHPAAVKLAWKPTLVQLYMTLDRPRKALSVIEELALKSTGSEKMQWQETLIGQYLLLGKTNQALAYTRELTRVAPTVPRWWKAQVHLLLEKQDYEAALEALVIYSKLTTLSPSEKRLLADLNLKAGIPAIAADYYRELAGTHPDADITKRLAHTLRLLDRRAEALGYIESYLNEKAAPDLLWLKGELLYEMQHYPAAAEVFRDCAQEASRAGRAWLMAGYAAWQARDYATAATGFTHAAAYPKQKKVALAALQELEAAVNEAER